MVICWNSTLVRRGRDITGGCNGHLRLPSRRGSRKNTERFPRRRPKAQASSGGVFYFYANKTHFHDKGFARSPVLNGRVF